MRPFAASWGRTDRRKVPRAVVCGERRADVAERLVEELYRTNGLPEETADELVDGVRRTVAELKQARRGRARDSNGSSRESTSSGGSYFKRTTPTRSRSRFSRRNGSG